VDLEILSIWTGTEIDFGFKFYISSLLSYPSYGLLSEPEHSSPPTSKSYLLSFSSIKYLTKGECKYSLLLCFLKLNSKDYWYLC